MLIALFCTAKFFYTISKSLIRMDDKGTVRGHLVAITDVCLFPKCIKLDVFILIQYDSILFI